MTKHVSILVNRYVAADSITGWIGRVRNTLSDARTDAHRYNLSAAKDGKLVYARPCYIEVSGDVISIDTLARVHKEGTSDVLVAITVSGKSREAIR